MLQPYLGTVLIKKIDDVEEKNVDGIIVPKFAQGDGKARGEVVALGFELKGKVGVGNKIIYKGEPMEIMEGDESFYLLNESDIVAITNFN